MSISREHIIREVQRTAVENGGKPLGRLSFFTQTGIKESDWRGKYWARWNEVLREAGYGPNSLVEGRDDATLLDRLAALAVELGRIPIGSEIRLKKRADPTFPNDKTFSRFGSKSPAATEAPRICSRTAAISGADSTDRRPRLRDRRSAGRLC